MCRWKVILAIALTSPKTDPHSQRSSAPDCKMSLNMIICSTEEVGDWHTAREQRVPNHLYVPEAFALASASVSHVVVQPLISRTMFAKHVPRQASDSDRCELESELRVVPMRCGSVIERTDIRSNSGVVDMQICASQSAALIVMAFHSVRLPSLEPLYLCMKKKSNTGLPSTIVH